MGATPHLLLPSPTALILLTLTHPRLEPDQRPLCVVV